jgi:hypothetical protein
LARLSIPPTTAAITTIEKSRGFFVLEEETMPFFMSRNKLDDEAINLFSRNKDGHACLWAVIHECALEHHQEIVRELDAGKEVEIVFTTKSEESA